VGGQGPPFDQQWVAAVAAALATASHDAGWPSLQPAIDRDPEFGKRVFEALVGGIDAREINLADRLTDDQLADAYVWLSRHYPPEQQKAWLGKAGVVTPVMQVHHWRDQIPQWLVARAAGRAAQWRTATHQ
jgi:hypothetical protein